MTNDTENDGLLTRWSRRKRGMEGEDDKALKSQSEVAAEDEEHQRQLEENRLAAEEIDLDTIDADSDLSLFMKEGVPAALRKAALAKLWRSDPVFSNIDGLVDYDENFADPKLIMKTFTSAYQVGKGYLKEILEDAEDAVAEAPDDLSEEALPDQQAVSREEILPANDGDELPEIDDEPLPEPTAPDHQEEPEKAPGISLRQRLDLA